MKQLLGILISGFVGAVLTISPAQAQLGGGVGDSNVGSGIYKLGKTSFYTEGCIAPCTCPVRLYEELRGTFKITLEKETSDTSKWIISNVNWLVTKQNEELFITGGGSLVFDNGIYELLLELDFGDETVSYKSGPLDDIGDFPNSIGFNLAEPEAFCFTTTFTVKAAELPVSQIRNYKLQNGVYASGCGLDPNDKPPGCLCPIQAQNLVGNFGLVSLGINSAGFREYSLVNVDLAAAAFTTPPFELFDIVGDAIFRVTDPPDCPDPPAPPCFIVLYKELFGRFTFGDSGQTVPMSSGLAIGGGEFPRIDIGVLDELPGCFGQSLYFNAILQRRARVGSLHGG